MQRTSDCVVFGLNLHICDRTPVLRIIMEKGKGGESAVKDKDQKAYSGMGSPEMSEKPHKGAA